VDASERFPDEMSNLELKGGLIVKRTRLKQSILKPHGDALMSHDPWAQSHRSDLAHDDWKRVIERYSITAITVPEERLIALAGIAELVSYQIGEKVAYVAGMWDKYLASQLLWHVNPKYENEKHTFPQWRPSEWRAPSFSWAAVEAPQGIKCADTLTEDELAISVDYINVKPQDEKHKFGFLQKEDCYIDMTCTLVQIRIEEEYVFSAVNPITAPHEAVLSIGYRWRLDQGDDEVRKMKLSHLYLDSPHDDLASLKKQQGIAFCIPAYKKASHHVNQLVCLLVQKVFPGARHGPPQYQRIGVSMVPEFLKGNIQEKIWSNTMGRKDKIRLI
jgi:hypothetical protein